MAKAEKTFDTLNVDIEAIKTTIKEKADIFKAFQSEHKLKIGKDHSDDPKIGKKWAKMKEELTALRAKRDGLVEDAKAVKPKKERELKPSKYEYPADVTTPDQKKKYRTAQRNAAKKAAQPDKPIKAEKVVKTKEVADAPKAKKPKSTYEAPEEVEAPAVKAPVKKKKVVKED